MLLQVTRADVGRMLRADILYLGLGLILLAAGAAAAAVYARSVRGREPSLPWFALFTFLYGLRLLARTDTFPLLFYWSPTFWRYAAATITYVIPIPAVLYLREMFPHVRARDLEQHRRRKRGHELRGRLLTEPLAEVDEGLHAEAEGA